MATLERPLDIVESNVNLYSGDLVLCDTYVFDFAKGAHWEAVTQLRYERIAESFMIRSFCPEKTLLDVLCCKLATVFRLGHLKSLIVFTKDGSPHSLQIHLAVQEAAENAGFSKDSIRHFVWEKDTVFQITDAAVRTARHLSEIQILLRKTRSDKR